MIITMTNPTDGDANEESVHQLLLGDPNALKRFDAQSATWKAAFLHAPHDGTPTSGTS